eukprot:9088468-Pyramimonas_sp.AAC.1
MNVDTKDPPRQQSRAPTHERYANKSLTINRWRFCDFLAGANAAREECLLEGITGADLHTT